MTLRSLCQSLLVLNLLYCTAALFLGELPGWKMFEAVQPLRYRLEDAQGRAIDVYEYLPRHAYLIDERQLERVVQFIRTREAARGPFRFEVNDQPRP